MGMGASFCPGFHKANQLPPWSCPGFKSPRGPMRPGCGGAWQGAGEARACRGAAVSRSAGWRTCSSTASCTCSSLPGATLLTLRKSSSGSATLFLVSVLWGLLWCWGALPGCGKGLLHPLQHEASLCLRPALPAPTQYAPLGITLMARGFSSLDVQC